MTNELGLRGSRLKNSGSVLVALRVAAGALTVGGGSGAGPRYTVCLSLKPVMYKSGILHLEIIRVF